MIGFTGGSRGSRRVRRAQCSGGATLRFGCITLSHFPLSAGVFCALPGRRAWSEGLEDPILRVHVRL